MSRKQQRATMMGSIFVVALLAVGLTLTALNKAVSYFYTPSELAKLETPPSSPIRLGGLVEAGSIMHGSDATVTFAVTDDLAKTLVTFQGVLPDLFREGQGVVVQGRVNPAGNVIASEVLAKHDENYMPREVAEALKEQGRWRDNEAAQEKSY